MPRVQEFDLLSSTIDPGLTVIEASAGTGKTYTISHLVPRLLLTGVLPDVSKLLLVTFTNDAARELADRVRRVLTRVAQPAEHGEEKDQPGVAALRQLRTSPDAEARLQRALLDLDLLAVSTIHAFCQRTLQAEGSLCGMPVMPEVMTTDAEYLALLLEDAWLRRMSDDPALAALATAEGWSPGEVSEFVKNVRRFGLERVEPPARTLDEVRRELERALEPLKDAAAQAEFERNVAACGWNKNYTAAAALAKVRPAFGGDIARCDFWAAVQFAGAELPGLLRNSGKDNKAARVRVVQGAWLKAAAALLTRARSLRWPLCVDIAREVLPKLSQTLSRRQIITQDGLIETLHQALHRTGATGAEQSERLASHLAAKYHVALIDESQDTDPRQFGIFSRIFLRSTPLRRLILVGDPKQAIYSFRGADVATYLAARDRAARQYTLTRTYRAPEPLVQAVNALFTRSAAFHHPGMIFRPASSGLGYDRELLRDGKPCSRLEVWLAGDAQPELGSATTRVASLSDRVATTIVDLLQRGELRERRPEAPEKRRRLDCSDFAVLVSTHPQANAMAEALLARNVPAVVNSGVDVFLSDEAIELRILLRAVAEPRRAQRVRAALVTRLLGLSAAELVQLDASVAAEAGAADAFAQWTERFETWRRIWETRGLAALFAALEGQGIVGTATDTSTGMDAHDAVSHRLAMLPLTGERRVTNYRQLTDLLLEASQTEAPRPAELLRWLRQQIARAEERCELEERQLQLSTDRAAVQIVTMHKAKGLEYPLVFCPYLADSIKAASGLMQLPERPGEPADLLVILDELDAAEQARRVAQKMTADLEERLRLAYVALTRAQVRAWTCSYTASKKAGSDNGSPLDWLLRPAADCQTYPAYSTAWVEDVSAARAQRHEAALRELGARPAAEDATALLTFEPPPDPSATPYPGLRPDAAKPLSAQPAPAMPAAWRVTSFSGLTREKHVHGSPLPTSDSGPRISPRERPDSSPGFNVQRSLAFFHAPAGAAVGTAVHDWIEVWDFGRIDDAALRLHLAQARLPTPADGASWEAILTELFGTLAEIQLPGVGAQPLRELAGEAHASEWHFHLPLANELTVADLARCFAQHAAPEHRAYAPLLASLDEERFRGLLQGFIDRLVRAGDAWGVIDWKTNRLGDAPESYHADALLHCAMEDHYLLQTHLYLVALRRYLRAIGLPEVPLAGAWLVFLRGIEAGTARGVLHIHPPAEMLDALDVLFAPPALPVGADSSATASTRWTTS